MTILKIAFLLFVIGVTAKLVVADSELEAQCKEAKDFYNSIKNKEFESKYFNNKLANGLNDLGEILLKLWRGEELYNKIRDMIIHEDYIPKYKDNKKAVLFCMAKLNYNKQVVSRIRSCYSSNSTKSSSYTEFNHRISNSLSQLTKFIDRCESANPEEQIHLNDFILITKSVLKENENYIEYNKNLRSCIEKENSSGAVHLLKKPMKMCVFEELLNKHAKACTQVGKMFTCPAARQLYLLTRPDVFKDEK